MRVRVFCVFLSLTLLVGLAALSPLTAQNPTPAAPPAARPAAPASRDIAKLSPLQRQMYLCVQSGADWLHRANRPDGRFEYGFLPCLKTKLDGDHYLRQVGAAYALARAARLTGDERHAAIARQAVLTLLLDTTTTAAAANQPAVRHTTLPSVVVNRLASAGLLVLAINELTKPADDLLEQSEALCRFIAKQQQADGSLSYVDSPAESVDPEGVNFYPGEALYGLMRSQQYRPAPWKTEVVRKALAYYRPWWQKHKNMAFVPWQTAAYAEAFVQSQGKEQAYADFIFEMNDWMCGLQYTRMDPRQPLWLGGFMNWVDGGVAAVAPQITSAAYAEGIAEACRTARQAGDVQRHQRYRESVERCLQFVTTLQYTDANTQHFADWYRPRLQGGFHASHQDGTLRIDYAQHAIGALVQYLTVVAE